MPLEKAIWISYDLGLTGDYNGLYKWLDSLDAKECGTHTALVRRDYPVDDDQMISEDIKALMSKHVRIDPNDRVYLILRDKEGLIKGKFIFGGRKKATWEGYSQPDDDSEDTSI